MIILNLLKSFVIPKNMGKYRNISAFITLLIFIFISGIVAIPLLSHLEKNKYDDKTFRGNEVYAFDIYDNLSNTDLDKIEELQFDVNNGKISFDQDKYKDLVNSDGYVEMIFNVYPTKGDSVENKIIIVFDLSKNENGDYIYSYDISEKYDKLKKEEGSDVTYLLVIRHNCLVYRNPYIVKNGYKISQVGTLLYTSNKNINFENITNAEYITNKLIDGTYTIVRSQYISVAFVYAGLFPIIISLLVWILFKRNGQLTRFKEYFNIAGIASIIPGIIVFILSWFLPNDLFYYYTFLFGIYYIYMIYKINNYHEV